MKFAITDFPTVGGYASWRQLTLRTIAVSSNGNQQDAFAWASVALSKETRLEDVRVPGAKFESLDGNLAQALLQLANARWGKGNDPFLDELYRQIISHDETCGRNGRIASGREFLWMVASHYSVREERSQIIGVLDMEKIHPKGGDLEALKDFLFRWFQMLSRSTLVVERGPYADELKKLFELRMKGIACMRDICRFYDIEKAQNPNAVDSYVYLRAQAAALIERDRHDKNQAELQRAIRDAGGKRSNATPAKSGGSAAASGGGKKGNANGQGGGKTDGSAGGNGKSGNGGSKQQSSSAPAPKAKGKAKSKPRSKSRERSSSRGRTPSAPGPRTKAPCFAFSRNKCKNGNKCSFDHRALTEEEKQRRDKWEKEIRDKGNDPYANNRKKDGSRGRSRERSASPAPPSSNAKRKGSVDRKKIPCKFHWTSGGCSKGADCPFSHKKAVRNAVAAKSKGSAACAVEDGGFVACAIPFPCVPKTGASGSGIAAPAKSVEFDIGGFAERDIDSYGCPLAPSEKRVSWAPLDSHGDPIRGEYRARRRSRKAPQTPKVGVTDPWRDFPFSECLLSADASIARERADALARQLGIRASSPRAFPLSASDLKADLSHKCLNATATQTGGSAPGTGGSCTSPPAGVSAKPLSAQRSPMAEALRRCLNEASQEMSAAATVVSARDVFVKKFIMDSGSGHNLLTRQDVIRGGHDGSQFPLKKPIMLHTAGGSTVCRNALGVSIPSLDEEKVSALVLQDTPAVLSMGQRCQKFGYSFVWPPFSSRPYMTSPSGRHIEMKVENFIPYLVIPDEDSAAPAATVGGSGPDGAGAPEAGLLRWTHVAMDAHRAHADPEALGGPPLEAVHRRVVYDLHSREVLEDTAVAEDGWLSPADFLCAPKDILAYYYYAATGAETPAAPSLDEEEETPVEGPPAKTGGSALGASSTKPETPSPGGGGRMQDSEMGEGDLADPEDTAAKTSHLFTHLPMDPTCRACRLAKSQRRPARRSPQRHKGVDPKAFGDEVHLDTWFVSEASRGFSGETCALTILDVATGWCECHPLKDRTSESVRLALRSFEGNPGTVKYIYSDGAGEFTRAAAMLGVPHDTAIPYNKNMNARVERQNRTIEEGTRTLLQQSGLPVCFWTFASMAFCLGYNLRGGPGGASPWTKRHGSPCVDRLVPFGAKIDFIPQGESDLIDKVGPKAVPGLYLGRMVRVGGVLDPSHFVVALSELHEMNPETGYLASGAGFRRPTVERCPEVHWDHRGVDFPMLKVSDAFFGSVRSIHIGAEDEGETWGSAPGDQSTGGSASRDSSPFDPPPADEPEPGCRVWSRVDTDAACFRTTLSSGPQWSQVVRRVTTDMDTGAVLDDEDVRGMTDKELHRQLPFRVAKLRTTLYYRDEDEQPVDQPDDPGGESSDDPPAIPRGPGGDPAPGPRAVGEIASWSRVDNGATHFVLTRAKTGPLPEAVLARTTQDLDSGDIIEDRALIYGRPDDEVFRKVPPAGRRTHRRIKTTLFYDPDYKRPEQPWVGDRYLRRIAGSTNPGIHPWIWRDMSTKQRKAAIDKFKAEGAERGRGPPPAPRMSLLSQLGVPMPLGPELAESAAPAFTAPKTGGSASGGELPTLTVCFLDERVKALHERSTRLPGDAGYNLYASKEVRIAPGECKSIPLGMAAQMTFKGKALPWFIRPRSVFYKNGIFLGYAVSLVHPNHTGEVAVQLINRTNDPIVIKRGDPVVQAVSVDGLPFAVRYEASLPSAGKVAPASPEALAGQDLAAARRVAAPRMPLEDERARDVHREKIPETRAPFNPFLDAVHCVSVAPCVSGGPVAAAAEAREPKTGGSASGTDSAVARSVTKKEAAANPDAQKALQKEWDRLRDINTWDESGVREWQDVEREAKASKKTVHVGRLFAICVEKNAELPQGHADRKFKGRVVFDGSFVRDQDRQVALFQELSSCPATMEASKAADIYGMAPGHSVQQADAKQAYTQSELGGTPTWVRLPREAWPSGWEKMRDPVCPLRLSLYGHPDSGGYWERHCERHLLSQGFVRTSPWRSCFFHKLLKLFLVVYVDDFKLAGPAANLAKGWDLVRSKGKDTAGIEMDDPTPVGRYLGCEHRLGERTITWHGKDPTAMMGIETPDDPGAASRAAQEQAELEASETGGSASGKAKAVKPTAGGSAPAAYPPVKVRVMHYDMSDFFASCVALYADLTRTDQKDYPSVPTPFAPECVQKEDGLGGPRGVSASPAEEALCDLITGGSVKTGGSASGDPAVAAYDGADAFGVPPGEPSGRLQPIAARVLMKILYGARMARFDLLRAVCGLASCVTKWTEQCDVDLFRLVCYIRTTVKYNQVSWVGDDLGALGLRLSADADLAGDPRTQRSTTGVISEVVGPSSKAALSATSRRQTAVSHSTCESEMVAADEALRAHGLPAQALWDQLLGRPAVIEFREDNDAVVKVCRSGGSMKLMHMNRTHRIDAAFVADCFGEGRNIKLRYTKTDDQAADICTKRFEDSNKWLHLLYLVNIVTGLFWAASSLDDYVKALYGDGFPFKSGGAHKPWIGSEGLKTEPGKPKKLTKAQKGRPTRAQATSGKGDLAAGCARDGSDDGVVPPTMCSQPTFQDVSSAREERPVPPTVGSAHGQRPVPPTVGSAPGGENPQATNGSAIGNSAAEDSPCSNYRGLAPGEEVRSSDTPPETGGSAPGSHTAAPSARSKTEGSAVGIAAQEHTLRGVLSYTGAFDGVKPTEQQVLRVCSKQRLEGECHRLFVEFCCGPNSLLGQATPASVGCEVVRCTVDHDMTTQRGYRHALEAIRRYHPRQVLLWSSIPCTGGSTWQHVNEAMFKENGDMEALQRLEGLRATFRLLWQCLAKLANHVLPQGTLCIEWPASCAYWKEEVVMRDMARWGMSDAVLHGCAYGLTTPKSVPVKKPWRVASTNPLIPRLLSRTCSGSHGHQASRGKVCKETESYTPSLAARIHLAFLLIMLAIIPADSCFGSTALPTLWAPAFHTAAARRHSETEVSDFGTAAAAPALAPPAEQRWPETEVSDFGAAAPAMQAVELGGRGAWAAMVSDGYEPPAFPYGWSVFSNAIAEERYLFAVDASVYAQQVAAATLSRPKLLELYLQGISYEEYMADKTKGSALAKAVRDAEGKTGGSATGAADIASNLSHIAGTKYNAEGSACGAMEVSAGPGLVRDLRITTSTGEKVGHPIAWVNGKLRASPLGSFRAAPTFFQILGVCPSGLSLPRALLSNSTRLVSIRDAHREELKRRELAVPATADDMDTSDASTGGSAPGSKTGPGSKKTGGSASGAAQRSRGQTGGSASGKGEPWTSFPQFFAALPATAIRVPESGMPAKTLHVAAQCWLAGPLLMKGFSSLGAIGFELPDCFEARQAPQGSAPYITTVLTMSAQRDIATSFNAMFARHSSAAAARLDKVRDWGSLRALLADARKLELFASEFYLGYRRLRPVASFAPDASVPDADILPQELTGPNRPAIESSGYSPASVGMFHSRKVVTTAAASLTHPRQVLLPIVSGDLERYRDDTAALAVSPPAGAGGDMPPPLFDAHGNPTPPATGGSASGTAGTGPQTAAAETGGSASGTTDTDVTMTGGSASGTPAAAAVETGGSAPGVIPSAKSDQTGGSAPGGTGGDAEMQGGDDLADAVWSFRMHVKAGGSRIVSDPHSFFLLNGMNGFPSLAEIPQGRTLRPEDCSAPFLLQDFLRDFLAALCLEHGCDISRPTDNLARRCTRIDHLIKEMGISTGVTGQYLYDVAQRSRGTLSEEVKELLHTVPSVDTYQPKTMGSAQRIRFRPLSVHVYTDSTLLFRSSKRSKRLEELVGVKGREPLTLDRIHTEYGKGGATGSDIVAGIARSRPGVPPRGIRATAVVVWSFNELCTGYHFNCPANFDEFARQSDALCATAHRMWAAARALEIPTCIVTGSSGAPFSLNAVFGLFGLVVRRCITELEAAAVVSGQRPLVRVSDGEALFSRLVHPEKDKWHFNSSDVNVEEMASWVVRQAYISQVLLQPVPPAWVRAADGQLTGELRNGWHKNGSSAPATSQLGLPEEPFPPAARSGRFNSPMVADAARILRVDPEFLTSRLASRKSYWTPYINVVIRGATDTPLEPPDLTAPPPPAAVGSKPRWSDIVEEEDAGMVTDSSYEKVSVLTGGSALSSAAPQTEGSALGSAAQRPPPPAVPTTAAAKFQPTADPEVQIAVPVPKTVGSAHWQGVEMVGDPNGPLGRVPADHPWAASWVWLQTQLARSWNPRAEVRLSTPQTFSARLDLPLPHPEAWQNVSKMLLRDRIFPGRPRVDADYVCKAFRAFLSARVHHASAYAAKLRDSIAAKTGGSASGGASDLGIGSTTLEQVIDWDGVSSDTVGCGWHRAFFPIAGVNKTGASWVDHDYNTHSALHSTTILHLPTLLNTGLILCSDPEGYHSAYRYAALDNSAISGAGWTVPLCDGVYWNVVVEVRSQSRVANYAKSRSTRVAPTDSLIVGVHVTCAHIEQLDPSQQVLREPYCTQEPPAFLLGSPELRSWIQHTLAHQKTFAGTLAGGCRPLIVTEDKSWLDHMDVAQGTSITYVPVHAVVPTSSRSKATPAPWARRMVAKSGGSASGDAPPAPQRSAPESNSALAADTVRARQRAPKLPSAAEAVAPPATQTGGSAPGTQAAASLAPGKTEGSALGTGSAPADVNPWADMTDEPGAEEIARITEALGRVSVQAPQSAPTGSSAPHETGLSGDEVMTDGAFPESEGSARADTSDTEEVLLRGQGENVDFPEDSEPESPAQQARGDAADNDAAADEPPDYDPEVESTLIPVKREPDIDDVMAAMASLAVQARAEQAQAPEGFAEAVGEAPDDFDVVGLAEDEAATSRSGASLPCRLAPRPPQSVASTPWDVVGAPEPSTASSIIFTDEQAQLLHEAQYILATGRGSSDDGVSSWVDPTAIVERARDAKAMEQADEQAASQLPIAPETAGSARGSSPIRQDGAPAETYTAQTVHPPAVAEADRAQAEAPAPPAPQGPWLAPGVPVSAATRRSLASPPEAAPAASSDMEVDATAAPKTGDSVPGEQLQEPTSPLPSESGTSDFSSLLGGFSVIGGAPPTGPAAPQAQTGGSAPGAEISSTDTALRPAAASARKAGSPAKPAAADSPAADAATPEPGRAGPGAPREKGSRKASGSPAASPVVKKQPRASSRTSSGSRTDAPVVRSPFDPVPRTASTESSAPGTRTSGHQRDQSHQSRESSFDPAEVTARQQETLQNAIALAAQAQRMGVGDPAVLAGILEQLQSQLLQAQSQGEGIRHRFLRATGGRAHAAASKSRSPRLAGKASGRGGGKTGGSASGAAPAPKHHSGKGRAETPPPAKPAAPLAPPAEPISGAAPPPATGKDDLRVPLSPSSDEDQEVGAHPVPASYSPPARAAAIASGGSAPGPATDASASGGSAPAGATTEAESATPRIPTEKEVNAFRKTAIFGEAPVPPGVTVESPRDRDLVPQFQIVVEAAWLGGRTNPPSPDWDVPHTFHVDGLILQVIQAFASIPLSRQAEAYTDLVYNRGAVVNVKGRPPNYVEFLVALRDGFRKVAVTARGVSTTGGSAPGKHAPPLKAAPTKRATLPTIEEQQEGAQTARPVSTTAAGDPGSDPMAAFSAAPREADPGTLFDYLRKDFTAWPALPQPGPARTGSSAPGVQQPASPMTGGSAPGSEAAHRQDPAQSPEDVRRLLRFRLQRAVEQGVCPTQLVTEALETATSLGDVMKTFSGDPVQRFLAEEQPCVRHGIGFSEMRDIAASVGVPLGWNSDKPQRHLFFYDPAEHSDHWYALARQENGDRAVTQADIEGCSRALCRILRHGRGIRVPAHGFLLIKTLEGVSRQEGDAAAAATRGSAPGKGKGKGKARVQTEGSAFGTPRITLGKAMLALACADKPRFLCMAYMGSRSRLPVPLVIRSNHAHSVATDERRMHLQVTDPIAPLCPVGVHMTRRSNLASILRDGLVPSMQNREIYEDRHHVLMLPCTPEDGAAPPAASHYRRWADAEILIHVDVRELVRLKYSVYAAVSGILLTPHTVPSKYFLKVTDGQGRIIWTRESSLARGDAFAQESDGRIVWYCPDSHPNPVGCLHCLRPGCRLPLATAADVPPGAPTGGSAAGRRASQQPPQRQQKTGSSASGRQHPPQPSVPQGPVGPWNPAANTVFGGQVAAAVQRPEPADQPPIQTGGSASGTRSGQAASSSAAHASGGSAPAGKVPDRGAVGMQRRKARKMEAYALEWDTDQAVRLGRSRMGCTRIAGAPLTVPPWEAWTADANPPYYEPAVFAEFRAPWYRYVRMAQATGVSVNQLGVSAWQLFLSEGFGPLCSFRGSDEDFPGKGASDREWLDKRAELVARGMPILIVSEDLEITRLWVEASGYPSCQKANATIAHRLLSTEERGVASEAASRAAELGSAKLANAFTGEAIRLAQLAERDTGEPPEEAAPSTAGEETPTEQRDDNRRKAHAARERSRARQESKLRRTGGSAAGQRRGVSARVQTRSSAPGDLWRNWRPRTLPPRTTQAAHTTGGSASGARQGSRRPLSPPSRPPAGASSGVRQVSRRPASPQRDKRPPESSSVRQPARRPRERPDREERPRAGGERAAGTTGGSASGAYSPAPRGTISSQLVRSGSRGARGDATAPAPARTAPRQTPGYRDRGDVTASPPAKPGAQPRAAASARASSRVTTEEQLRGVEFDPDTGRRIRSSDKTRGSASGDPQPSRR